MNKQRLIHQIKAKRNKAILDFNKAMKNADLLFLHNHVSEYVSFTPNMESAWQAYRMASFELYDLLNVRV